MPSMQEMGVKARKVEAALKQEAKRLRGAGDDTLAKTLEEFANHAGTSSLSRLFDLIQEHPTKQSALVALEGGKH